MRDPNDSRDLPLAIKPPTSAPVERVFDVLLVTTGGGAGRDGDFGAHPPVGDPPIDLGRGLTIAKLERGLAELVMNACELRGHYFRGQRQYGCRYAFVLERPSSDAYVSAWDQDGVINTAVALSRLVRDNNYSTEYAARVSEYADGELRVFPLDLQESRHTYRFGDERDWLDESDAHALAALLDAYWEAKSQFPDRLTGALWRCEHLVHERWLDIALPGLVAALDGLVNTNHEQVTRQFVTWSSPGCVDTGLLGRFDLDGFGRFGPCEFVVGGAEHAEGGVSALAVVEGLDVVEDGALEPSAGRPAVAVDESFLERGEEALGDGVVVAVAA